MNRQSELMPTDPDNSEFLIHFYEQYKDFLYFVVRQYTKNPYDMDDVVQDAWCRLIPHAQTLKTMSKSGQLGYIKRAVESAFLDFQSKHYPKVAMVPLEDERVAQVKCQDRDMVSDLYRRDQIRKLQAELPDRDWAALTRKYYFGCSDREVAKRIGVKPNSVRTLVGRIRKKAQEILNGGSLIGGGGNVR